VFLESFFVPRKSIPKVCTRIYVSMYAKTRGKKRYYNNT